MPDPLVLTTSLQGIVLTASPTHPPSPAVPSTQPRDLVLVPPPQVEEHLPQFPQTSQYEHGCETGVAQIKGYWIQT